MRAPAAAALAALLLAACSGGGTPDARPTPSRTAAPTPSASPSPSPRPTRSASAKPSPTPSPAVTGTPLGASGSALHLVSDGEVKSFGPNADDCAALYPDLLDVSCDELKLNGGSLLWVAGTSDGRWALRLLAFDVAAGGYRLRYQATDGTAVWTGFRLGATSLTGYGTDGLVVATLIGGSQPRRAYDVLTWRRGGPLVLRAHRTGLRLGRVVLAKGRVDEYEALYAEGDSPCCPSRFVHRRVAWDGRRFLLATVGPVPAAKVPPGD